jgi:hypothetical protein
MIMPFKLRMCFVWFTVTLIGIWSPLRKPPFSTSIVAVIVFPFRVVRLPFCEPDPSVAVLIDRMPYSVPEAFPLLL